MGVAARERAARFAMERIAEEYLAWYGKPSVRGRS
jgi:hypothetical protein